MTCPVSNDCKRTIIPFGRNVLDELIALYRNWNLRWRALGNTIWVDVSHRDFQNRLKRNRLGKEQFDDRLLSYLATLVSAHYRELAYQQLGTTPESCNEIFCDMIDIYVRLEEHLRNNLPALLKQLEKEQQFPVGTSNATSTPASVANISPFLRRRWRGSR